MSPANRSMHGWSGLYEQIFLCPHEQFLRAGYCFYHHSHCTYIHSLLVCLSAKYKTNHVGSSEDYLLQWPLSWNINVQNAPSLAAYGPGSLPHYSRIYPLKQISNMSSFHPRTQSAYSQIHSIKIQFSQGWSRTFTLLYLSQKRYKDIVFEELLRGWSIT